MAQLVEDRDADLLDDLRVARAVVDQRPHVDDDPRGERPAGGPRLVERDALVDAVEVRVVGGRAVLDHHGDLVQRRRERRRDVVDGAGDEALEASAVHGGHSDTVRAAGGPPPSGGGGGGTCPLQWPCQGTTFDGGGVLRPGIIRGAVAGLLAALLVCGLAIAAPERDPSAATTPVSITRALALLSSGRADRATVSTGSPAELVVVMPTGRRFATALPAPVLVERALDAATKGGVALETAAPDPVPEVTPVSID